MNKKIKLFLVICLTSVFLLSGTFVSFAVAPTNYIQWITNESITFGDTDEEASNIMWYDIVDSTFDISQTEFFLDKSLLLGAQIFMFNDRFQFRGYLEGAGEWKDLTSAYFGYRNYDALDYGIFYSGCYYIDSDTNAQKLVEFPLFYVNKTNGELYFPSVSDESFEPILAKYFTVINGDNALVFNPENNDRSPLCFEIFESFFINRIYYRTNYIPTNSYTLTLFDSEDTIIGNGLYNNVELLVSDSLEQINTYTLDSLQVGQSFSNITQIEVVNNNNATLLLELFVNNELTTYTISPNSSSPTIDLIGDTNLYLSVSTESSTYTISGLYRFKSGFISQDIPSLFEQINNIINVSFTFPYADDVAISQLIYNLEYIAPTTVNEEYVIYATPISVSNDDIGLFIYDPLMNYDNVNNYYLPTSVYMNKYNIIDFGDTEIQVDYITYTILNRIGEFGDFENTNGTYIDNLGLFLLNSVDGFLSFQIVPGFSLYNLLTLVIAIPLLLYILKLFLGG